MAALVERHADELVGEMRQALAAAGTLEEGMRALIAAGIGAHRINAALHKILSEQVPRVGRLAKVMDTHTRIARLIERFLRIHAERLSPHREPATAAIVVETIMESLVHKAVLECPHALTDETVKREALSAVLGYLTSRA